ncbi:type II toxin-antitoxin system Phd/YefM family antitoxin [Lentilactobacillus hilgardii]|nr:type II toxin-antitoxin system Phd/YefM family antitoxin [Lentilactobacillus hilgardii]MCV3739914.1 type II toxin-antitoxin system Phd/YefM family antitoxin [Lentilactobacillus hilgardii]
MRTYTPTSLRKHLFQVLKNVVNSDDEIEITVQAKDNSTRKSVVLINKDRLNQLKKNQLKTKDDFYNTPEAKEALKEAINSNAQTIGNGSLKDFDSWINQLEGEAKKNRQI